MDDKPQKPLTLEEAAYRLKEAMDEAFTPLLSMSEYYEPWKPTLAERIENFLADLIYKPCYYTFKAIRFVWWQVEEAWKDSEYGKE